MIRHAALRRVIGRLALAAALLLAVAPAIGQFLHAQPQSTASLMMCTVDGLKSLATVDFPPSAPDSTPQPGHDGHCPYCFLPAPLQSSPPHFAALSWEPAPSPQTTQTDRSWRASGHPSGLGSRGPPLAST